MAISGSNVARTGRGVLRRPKVGAGGTARTTCHSMKVNRGQTTVSLTVSAYATASGLCLAQEHTRGKGNEIPAIKALLDAMLDAIAIAIAMMYRWPKSQP